MTDPDPEFEEFLRKRRPLFRDLDDGLEPPADLDRIVLRQARQAIEPEQPMRVYRSPRWAAPVAIAATLVLGLAFVLQFGTTSAPEVQPQVTVENVAQRTDYPPPPAPPPPASRVQEAAAENGTVVVDLAPQAGPDAAAWRRNAESWQAEIQRLRASGETARADAEQAEFNRQHRAYASSPDR